MFDQFGSRLQNIILVVRTSGLTYNGYILKSRFVQSTLLQLGYNTWTLWHALFWKLYFLGEELLYESLCLYVCMSVICLSHFFEIITQLRNLYEVAWLPKYTFTYNYIKFFKFFKFLLFSLFKPLLWTIRPCSYCYEYLVSGIICSGFCYKSMLVHEL